MAKVVAFLVGTLQTGGIERSVTDWCLHLKKTSDWTPVVICLLRKSGPFLDTLESNGVRVEECRVHDPWFSWRLMKLIRSIGPNAVHSQVAFSMPWQVLGILMSGRRKIVFTQQNDYQNWNPLGARLRLRLYFGLFFRFIDHYTCVSEKVRTSLSRLSGHSAKDFLIIPNGVNTDLFFPDSAERMAQREMQGFANDCFLVGMVGRFSPQKGHKFLIDAASILKSRNLNFKILLIGVGELETEIRRLVRQNELEDFVLFYGQALNVNKLLQALDTFILPSLWEGMPLALLEAMASGIAVIGSDVAGTREVIEDKVNGLLIPPKNPEAIAQAISSMKNDPAFRAQLAMKALTIARARYSVRSNITAYLNLYEQ